MELNLPGKVRTLRLHSSQGLKPVCEAVANSIQAIEDAEEPNGSIEIRIDRGNQMVNAGDKNVPTPPPRSFSITDNGVGFTSVNQDSFDDAYSMLKASRGCKGVGRFFWLKAFDHAEVESNYREGGKNWTKKFSFKRTPDGVENMTVSPSSSPQRQTTVRLVGLQERFREASPKTAETIALRIVEYCLPQFIQKKAPRIKLIDSDGQELDLNAIFSEMQFFKKTEAFKIENHRFQITHLMVPASRVQAHRLHLCADGWTLKGCPISDRVPELRTTPSPLRDMSNGGRQMFYYGFLSGTLLDEDADADRSEFAFESDDELFHNKHKAVAEAMMAKAVEQIKGYLEPHLAEIRQKRDEEIRQHVYDHSPQYRPMLKHRPELVADIPPNLSADKLELKLFEANQQYKTELNEEYHRLLSQQDGKVVEMERHRHRVEAFLEEWNEEGMAQLAAHVAYRKATLAFLKQELERDREGNYALENAIHRVIFPLKATSDDVPWDRQNLWIIDEKLAYHYYLASDKAARRPGARKAAAKDRPDIIVFDRPIAVVDSEPAYQSVMIFEFKRAMRDDYTESDNPIMQIISYVRKLKTGKELDRHGRPIPVGESTPYYGYVVCDVTTKLGDIARVFGLIPTPDGYGYFGMNSGIYFEVVPFWKLLENARLRNKRLFDLLGFRATFDSVISPKQPVSVSAQTAAI